MDILGIGETISKVLDGVIDKVIPDAADREKFKLEARRINLDETMEPLKLQLSAIIEEAKSADKWTSRARPMFLYTCYLLILSSIPMGVLYAFSPNTANLIVLGFQAWLNAIPKEIITLMGVGYLGYTGARSWDKSKNGK